MTSKAINCPNCGAPITSDHCEYCGAVFYDWAAISDETPTIIKIVRNGTLVLLKGVMTSAELIDSGDASVLYADNNPVFVSRSPEYDLHVSFHVVADNGILATKYLHKEMYGQRIERS